MILSKRIRLFPTKEQEILFKKSCGVARWSYNYFRIINLNQYEIYIANNKLGRSYYKETEVRKHINNDLKNTSHKWLKEVSSNVMKQAVKDCDIAFKRYFKGVSGKPKPRKKALFNSFYVNYETLKRVDGGFQGEKLGFVKTKQSLPKIKGKYSNPRIKFEGGYWYLTVGIEIKPKKEKLTTTSLGIDLGLKSLAVCSNGKTYKNINKSKNVKRLKAKLKKEQRKLSRKFEGNIKSRTFNEKGIQTSIRYKRPLNECKNYIKQSNKINKIYKRLRDIRQNYLHQVTFEIVKTKPFQIVIEDLNVKGMMKNKHLSKAISEQGFYEFRRLLTYKSKLQGTILKVVDKWFPSSKKCSCCGNIKKDLRLSDRVYKCDNCGIVIDRDYNASVNLANYI